MQRRYSRGSESAESLMEFTNKGDMFAFAVMLKGDKTLNDIHILPGTAILLEPNETIDVSNAEFMIAKPKRG